MQHSLLSADKLLTKALDRRKPFAAATPVSDALLWESVLEQSRDWTNGLLHAEHQRLCRDGRQDGARGELVRNRSSKPQNGCGFLQIFTHWS